MQKNKFILAAVLLLIIKTSYISYAENDIVIMKDGSEYRGKLDLISPGEVILKTGDGIKTLDKKGVHMVTIQNERKYDSIKKIADMDDKDITDAVKAFAAYKPAKGDDTVYFLQKTTLSFRDGKTIRNVKSVFKVFTDAGKDSTRSSYIYEKSGGEAKLLYGLTITPEGEIYTVREDAINDEPSDNSSPLYDLYRKFKFSLPHPDTGNIFAYEYEITENYDEFSNPVNETIYLKSDAVIMNKELVINNPKSPVKYLLSKGEAKAAAPKIEQTSGIFSVRVKWIDKIVISEDSIPSERFIIPHVYIYQDTDFKEKVEKHFSVLKDEPHEELIDNYIKENGLDKYNSDEVCAKIFYHINDTTVHANFSPSYTGYKLTPLDKILSNKKLNSFDKSYLYYSIMKKLGINVDMFLLKPEQIVTAYNKINPIVFYSAAGCLLKNGDKNQIVIFDGDQRSFGYINPIYENGTGLLITADRVSSFKVGESVIRNKDTHVYKIDLNRKNAFITKKSEYTGPCSENIRRFRYMSNEELTKMFKQATSNVKIGAEFVSYTFDSDLKNRDISVRLERVINVPDYTIDSGNLSLLYLPEFNYDSTIAASRKYTMLINDKSEQEREFVVTLPDNVKIRNLPNNRVLRFDKSSFSIEYRMGSDNKIVVNVRSVMNKTLIPVNKYRKFKEFIETRSVISKTPIVLEVM